MLAWTPGQRARGRARSSADSAWWDVLVQLEEIATTSFAGISRRESQSRAPRGMTAGWEQPSSCLDESRCKQASSLAARKATSGYVGRHYAVFSIVPMFLGGSAPLFDNPGPLGSAAAPSRARQTRRA
jgi:hypothetical protein